MAEMAPAADADGVVWLAINAKYSHTSLSVRYLREAVPGSRILEVTINDYLLPTLGAVYEMQPKVLGIACYIWNIERVKELLQLLRRRCRGARSSAAGRRCRMKQALS